MEAIDLIRQLWSGAWVSHDGPYYQAPVTRLYDVPDVPVPVYMAARGPNSAQLAGQHGDGWMTGAADLKKSPELLQAFQESAQANGKDPSALPICAETLVVVGNEEDARAAASLWHFQPKAWTRDFLYDPDPRSIQRTAEEQIPLEDVYQHWPVSEDPAVHQQAMQQVLDSGATQVYVHGGQQDQRKVIEFYGTQVLPALRARS